MGDGRQPPQLLRLRCNTDKPHDGFVPLDLVTGRAYAVVWPLRHWAWLGTPGDFDGVSGAVGVS